MARDCAISYCMKIKVYACRVSVTVSRAHCWVEHDYQPLPETCLCLYIHDAQWIQITTLIIINHSSARPLPETCVYGYSGSTYTDVRIRPLVEAFGPCVGAWMPCQRTRLLLPCRYLRAAPTRAERARRRRSCCAASHGGCRGPQVWCAHAPTAWQGNKGNRDTLSTVSATFPPCLMRAHPPWSRGKHGAILLFSATSYAPCLVGSLAH